MKTKTKITAIVLWLIVAMLPLIVVQLLPETESNMNDVFLWYHHVIIWVVMVALFVGWAASVGRVIRWLFDYEEL